MWSAAKLRRQIEESNDQRHLGKMSEEDEVHQDEGVGNDDDHEEKWTMKLGRQVLEIPFCGRLEVLGALVTADQWGILEHRLT